jgi:hypothetical protein
MKFLWSDLKFRVGQVSKNNTFFLWPNTRVHVQFKSLYQSDVFPVVSHNPSQLQTVKRSTETTYLSKHM